MGGGKRMRRAFIAVCAGLYLATPAISNAGNVITLGDGLRGCGNWIEYRRQPNSNGEQLMKAWFWGFASGVAAGQQNFDSINLPPPAAMSAWLDKYCRENPLHDIALGAYALVREVSPPPGKR